LFASGPVFEQGDLFHPQTRAERIAVTAQELGIAPTAMEVALYADRPGAQVVIDGGPDWRPEALLTRYNLELHRSALYWSNLYFAGKPVIKQVLAAVERRAR
jgi:predicted nuclease of restriction endonuclease-like RecB superfamily